MATELYLDTARFGRMRLRAQEAERDFARLCGAEGGSLAVEDLLRCGSLALPEPMRRRYPGLSHWRGIGALKRTVGDLLEPSESPQVLLAGQSGTLMRLAARALFSHCRRVLMTDLEWPPYAEILRAEGRRVGREVWCVDIERRINGDGIGKREVIDCIAEEYRRQGCDGLFLSAVGYRGVILPVDGIMQSLEGQDGPKFLVVDAAQALGHIAWRIRECDIVLGGVHKWLRSGRPLGLGFACSLRARQTLRESAGYLASSGDLSDPLYRFMRQLEGERTEPLGETADLSGLFCAAAAVHAEACEPVVGASRFDERVANSVAIEDASKRTSWRPIVPGPQLRSGILMLKNHEAEAGRADAESVRTAFHRRGIALSAYDGGLIRLSMPCTHWLDEDLASLRSALKACQ